MSWTAHVWVKWNKSFSKGQTWEWMKDWKEVGAAWSLMGDWDMLLEIKVSTPEELENFIWNKLRAKDWVADTHSTWAKEVWHKTA